MNLQWAKGWLREFTPEGIAKTMSMYADQVDFEDVTLGHKESTSAGIQKFFTGFARGPSEHRFEVTYWAGDNKGGAMEWTWHSKHETDIFGVQAKGKQTTVRGISYLELRDGKIVVERDYWDCATLLRQTQRAEIGRSAERFAGWRARPRFRTALLEREADEML
jgi:steroid delta-isomerase-like uncharacterized protein